MTGRSYNDRTAHLKLREFPPEFTGPDDEAEFESECDARERLGLDKPKQPREYTKC